MRIMTHDCLVIAVSTPRQNICASPPARCAPLPAHWMVCRPQLTPQRNSIPHARLSRRRCDLRWRWRISSATTAQRTAQAHARSCGRHRAPRHGGDRGMPDASIGRSCRTAAPTAGSFVARTTPAAIGTARSARAWHAREWLAERVRPNCCRCRYFHVVFTLPRRDRRHRVPEQGGRLRPSCSARRPRRCARSPPIPKHLGARDRHHRRAPHLGISTDCRTLTHDTWHYQSLHFQ